MYSLPFGLFGLFSESIKTLLAIVAVTEGTCFNDQIGKKRTWAMKSLNLWDIKVTLLSVCACVHKSLLCLRVWFSSHCRSSIAEHSIHFKEIILLFWRTTTFYSSSRFMAPKKETTNNVCWFDTHSHTQLEIFVPLVHTMVFMWNKKLYVVFI